MLAERLEQVRSTASVLPKSWFLCPTMCLKPIAEGGHKNWGGSCVLDRFTRADPTAHQVLMKELHSEVRVITNLSSLEMGTSAAAKMLTEGSKGAEIDVRQNAAFPLNETAEMGGRSNVSNGARWGISLMFEVICKPVDVWSTDSTAQPP
jgi:hypothetical protein